MSNLTTNTANVNSRYFLANKANVQLLKEVVREQNEAVYREVQIAQWATRRAFATEVLVITSVDNDELELIPDVVGDVTYYQYWDDFRRADLYKVEDGALTVISSVESGDTTYACWGFAPAIDLSDKEVFAPKATTKPVALPVLCPAQPTDSCATILAAAIEESRAATAAILAAAIEESRSVTAAILAAAIEESRSVTAAILAEYSI